MCVRVAGRRRVGGRAQPWGGRAQLGSEWRPEKPSRLFRNLSHLLRKLRTRRVRGACRCDQSKERGATHEQRTKHAAGADCHYGCGSGAGLSCDGLAVRSCALGCGGDWATRPIWHPLAPVGCQIGPSAPPHPCKVAQTAPILDNGCQTSRFAPGQAAKVAQTAPIIRDECQMAHMADTTTGIVAPTAPIAKGWFCLA